MTSSPDEPSPADARVPARALVISILALAVPLSIYLAFPAVAADELGLLVWLTALIPAFLLTYHRAWQGASVALAASMAAVSLTHLVQTLNGLDAPPTPALLAVISVLIAVSLGAGWLSERLHGARRSAESLALTDSLTGLANRRHLTVFLESAFASASRGMPLSVVLFDLDRFKQINDNLGHVEGDRVLREFGRILADRTREMNLSGRWGGEEFLSVLTGTDARGAAVFAEHVRTLLANRPFTRASVTVSAGVAGFEPSMKTPELLVAAADQALYHAKERGRNRVVTAGEGRPSVAGAAPPSGAHILPPASSAEHSGEDAPDGIPQGRDEVLLVVDDDRDARRSVSRALSRVGYQVLQAAGPDEALEIVRGRDEPVDLLVTDVIMPSMSGFRLVEILMREVPALRVVYMSGYTQEGVDWEGAPGRVSVFLGKPMSVQELARAVRSVLDHNPPGTLPDPGGSGDPVPAPAPHLPDESPRLPEQRQEHPVVPAALADSKLLVVDDDADVLRSLTLLLGRCGFRNVRGTTDPADLPVHLARYLPDLVLLDLNMPDFDGLEVLSVFQEFDRESFLPVVAMTGEDDPSLCRRALAAGASDFVQKPVEIWELEARIRNLLRIRATTRTLTSETGRLEARVAARTAELEEARTDILHRLAIAGEYRDDVTGNHAHRVGTLSGLLAEALDVESEERDLIERAAPLHDLGKIGVEDRVLRKPGPLDEKQMAAMRHHCRIGAEILSGSRFPLLRKAREIALAHHERWDGSGYPGGLAGKDIPLSARIVAVADVFDSLTHDRPYRSALPEEEALDHLREGAGTLFDPEIVSALLDLHERGLVADAEAVQIIAYPTSGPPEPPSEPST